MSPDLDIRAVILLPGAVTIDLTPSDGTYDFEKTSQETEQQALRKTTVNNRWVEGTFTTSAVRENVREPLSIWIEGNDPAHFVQLKDVLTTAVQRRSWQLQVSHWEGGDELVRRTYSCQSSEYTLTTTQEYRMANMGLLKVEVDRLPHVVTVYP